MHANADHGARDDDVKTTLQQSFVAARNRASRKPCACADYPAHILDIY